MKLNKELPFKKKTIKFRVLAPKVVGDAPFKLTASSTSENVIFNVSSNTAVATISASIVQLMDQIAS